MNQQRSDGQAHRSVHIHNSGIILDWPQGHKLQAISLSVLRGEQGARRDIVLLNAGAALAAPGQAGGLREGLERAARAIDSGRALEVLEHLLAFTDEAI